jgi:molecular chaperone GrpE (heat shock protein)
MSEPSVPKLARWPFYLGDGLLLAVAGYIVFQGSRPLGAWDVACLTACVALGALLGALPHGLDHRAASRIAEAQHLDHAVLQVQNIDSVARQISSATAGWQAIQDDAAKAVQSAKEIADSMTVEARAFQDFLLKANDTEKNHLRLEVEKLHRAEAEWLQVLTRILDHTYSIHQAALRSGKPGLVEQLGNFQKACREAARRVGLAPFAPKTGDPFDAQQHQLVDAEAKPPPDAVVGDTLATGYRYQGQVVRLPLVSLKGSRDPASDLSLRMINQRREREGTPSPAAPAPAAPEEPADTPAAPASAALVVETPTAPEQPAEPAPPAPQQESLTL